MWTYKGETLTTPPAGALGFVYLITNLETGRKYIGRKQFYSTTRKKQAGKTRRKVTTKESKWMDYYGSCNALLIDIVKYGANAFNREVLRLCKSKAELSYYEAAYQFQADVLYAVLPNGEPAYYNANILSRWFRPA